MKNYALAPDVSVVRLNDSVLEFFKTNTREQVRIRVENDTILNIVNELDGTLSLGEIAQKYDLSIESVEELICFLSKKGLLDDVRPEGDFKEYNKYRRVINFLNDYSESHDGLIDMWENIRNATVVIVGLGAVGSWVSCNLVQSGVNSIILMDDDVVEISNMHRQFGYTEKSLGKKKTEALADRLLEYNPKLKVVLMETKLDDKVLHELDDIKIDLIINCADKPTVDQTSLWIGEYCMKRTIPHIVGGGYTLHSSLIGQTVIPYESACVKCFEKQLKEENKIDRDRVKKLAVKNRKVGSFGPMCSIIASMIGMEAIKVLTKCIKPANMNRRGELNIYTMEINYRNFDKRKDCEWCGKAILNSRGCLG